MLAAEKTVKGGFSGKKPWRGVFALAVQASGWTVVGNAGSAGPDSRDGLLCQPWAHTTPDCARLVTQSWSPHIQLDGPSLTLPKCENKANSGTSVSFFQPSFFHNALYT